MSKKRIVKKEESGFRNYGEEFGQDENFFFIAGLTKGGVPYGITWEEAFAQGLVDDEEKKTYEIPLPF
ncbi:hypothetical protein [Sporosarcina cyprini]|uniref:hypothetical protein n=1 Tax=Sporosarcina cyprini TaxID=2910523 RepID=UPI001EDFE015|nr:hypothetical protein [Sporosarcina cyprini]MCG3086435.1 hypothetical protein [Sporosarcina cyprini]